MNSFHELLHLNEMADYIKTMTVNRPAGKVYQAITAHIADWWSNDLTGSAAVSGERFTIAFGKTRKTFEIVEAVPDEKVVWKCLEAHIDMETLKNKSEWVDTTLIWTIQSEGENTVLTFLHKGLNRDLECYLICENGWDTFLVSLETYLLTGTGKPFLKRVVETQE